jgi:enterochelin esterase-like enzyme
MGGYGALRIGQKYPGIFSSIYLLSPASLMQNENSLHNTRSFQLADSIKTIEEFSKADFATKIIFACAAAWSPDPVNPPFYIDLPVKNGQLRTQVLSKWAANMQLTTLDQFIGNLKQLKAIAFDAGTKDEDIAASIKVLDAELNKYRVKHTFEIYEGNHINRIAQRIKQNMLSFFSTNLSFAGK